ncbi:hypothetical protein JX265_010594 [Neoarthrinium moseri]|uniref:Rhodopsin domain-containing protein n=1 Tax=Neoarthrinium moseri TaxID=1658444 RepID=A0A9P9WE82_9PEZI|nr:uncharacterized protein JN550_011129 [Neoarthrinium moseri]KAI1846217.1 hypothetical protein JX266_007742 [Neoarthrinium moseri]KAI1859117.1 hypothetical protein JX265_010594 [Neoarthrinium moseri]KAI1860974.1 hypothetical protein JN550_011129 [Neoarthrinium moseri]
MADPSVVELWVLLSIGLFTIALRLFARWHAVGFRNFQADDYLMIIASGVYAAESSFAYNVIADYNGLANNGMTEEERAALDPNSEEYAKRVGGSKTQVSGWVTYVLLLWVLKAAMCAFLLRLTERLDGYRIRIYIGFGLIIATYIIVTLSILLSCQPLSNNWKIYPDPGRNCQPAVSLVNVLVTLAFNIATDLYLLTIPIPMFWAANIKTWKKVGLIVLFSGGIFVMVAGTLRCVLILSDDVTGAKNAGAWAVRETFVATVTSNLPLIFPLLKAILGPLVGSAFSSAKKTYSNSIPLGSIPLSGGWRNKSQNHGHSVFTSTHRRGSSDAVELPKQGIKVQMEVEVSATSSNIKDGQGDRSSVDTYLGESYGKSL